MTKRTRPWYGRCSPPSSPARSTAKRWDSAGRAYPTAVFCCGLVAIAGIVSASVVPDTYYKTKLEIAEVEAENIPASRLGQWLSEQHLKHLRELMESRGFGHFLKKYTTVRTCGNGTEGESERLHENLRKSLGTPKEAECRKEMAQFRATFHKPAIYASWPWEETVEDALRQAGFASFEEQAAALEAQRAANMPK